MQFKQFNLADFIDNVKTPVCIDTFPIDAKVAVFVCPFLHAPIVVVYTWEGLDCPLYLNCYADGTDAVSGRERLYFKPKPKIKKIVPFDAEDLKRNVFIFRVKSSGDILLFSREYYSAETRFAFKYQDSNGEVRETYPFTLKEIMKDFEYTKDCVNWHPCQKEIEVEIN